MPKKLKVVVRNTPVKKARGERPKKLIPRVPITTPEAETETRVSTRGYPKEKMSVFFDVDLARKIRASARASSVSFNAWMAMAAAHFLGQMARGTSIMPDMHALGRTGTDPAPAPLVGNMTVVAPRQKDPEERLKKFGDEFSVTIEGETSSCPWEVAVRYWREVEKIRLKEKKVGVTVPDYQIMASRIGCERDHAMAAELANNNDVGGKFFNYMKARYGSDIHELQPAEALERTEDEGR